VIASAALGPSRRRYANGVALVRCDLAPPALLALLKAVERRFGRRGGRRWGERVLDLDIVLWDGGSWRGGVGAARLVVPHEAFRERGFVLGPALAVAPLWRDPRTGLTLRQLAGRHARHGRRRVGNGGAILDTGQCRDVN
jgi:2-amino-4-hydroxy-6-hydroxymethyldihydropteridine diphosphokinase